MPANYYLRRFLFTVITAVLAGVVFSDVAHAQMRNVNHLLSQLTNSEHKIRISAALSLSKLKTERAAPQFIRMLRDSDKTVRGVVAHGLGQIVGADTKQSLRTQATNALKRSSETDRDSLVRKRAKASYQKLLSLEPKELSGIYVNIGAMGQVSGNVDDYANAQAHMRKSVQKTFKMRANDMMIAWPKGKSPTARELFQRKFKAFHVNGTLNELRVSNSGGSTTVSCKVSMLIASYPEKSMFGFLKGGAKVQASSSAKEVQYAKEDCVAAVVEDLIARKVIPTIKARP